MLETERGRLLALSLYFSCSFVARLALRVCSSKAANTYMTLFKQYVLALSYLNRGVIPFYLEIANVSGPLSIFEFHPGPMRALRLIHSP